MILQWFYNDVQPPGVRRPQPWNLAGPFHRFVQPWSVLYFVANTGFGQLQHDVGLAPPDYDYFAAFHDPASERAMGARARLLEVIDIAAAANRPLGIVLWPSFGERAAEGDFLREQPLFAQVLEVCDERALSCLDIRPALRSVSRDESLIVSRYDAHPNALANRIAAEAVATWLPELLSRRL